MRMVLVVFLLLLCGVGVASASPAHNITSGDLKMLLNKDKKIFLLDVRTVEEFRQARLRGATLIPIGEIERRYGEIPKDRPVVVYCAVGSRSGSDPVDAFEAPAGRRHPWCARPGRRHPRLGRVSAGRTPGRYDLAGEAGMLVAFPAETTHEVTPVAWGERYSIVTFWPSM